MTTTGDVTLPVSLVVELPWVWEHQCGYLNRGRWTSGAVCLGCRFEVTREPETSLYLLVEASRGEV